MNRAKSIHLLTLLLIICSITFGQTEQSEVVLNRSETAIRANLVRLITPAATPESKKAGPDGIIHIQIVIDEKGFPISTRALTGSPSLQELAAAAARACSFKPFMLNGAPVKATGILTYDFSADPPSMPAKATYAQLVERARKKDAFMDFTALRMAYAESSDYDPYGPDRGLLNSMMTSINGNDYKQAAAQAEKIFEKNYVNITAHIVASISYGELNNKENADYNRYVANGLIDSILESGDGKTPQTAFVVISTNEEYAILQFKSLRPTGQALIKEGVHSYDKLMAIDPKTNKKSEFYFQIDKVFGSLDKIFKK